MAKKKQAAQEEEIKSPIEFSEEPVVNTVAELISVEKREQKGNWKKVSPEELKMLEESGKLIGYNPSTQEALTEVY